MNILHTRHASRLPWQGVWLFLYLDNWLLLASSLQSATITVHALLQLCAQLGLQVNLNKSHLQPTQSFSYSGMVLYSIPLLAFPSQAGVNSFLKVHELCLVPCQAIFTQPCGVSHPSDPQITS